jgi:D-inositol-3-phosphate glycosyltransferase
VSQNGHPLRIATLSVHACPLAPLGAWETGGMNVYIREVSRHLSDLGVEVDVFTRQQGDDHGDAIVPLAERARVIHIPAGPGRYLPKERVVEHLPEFICNLRDFVQADNPRYDVIHSHYWLSGRVAGYFKSAWQVPMLAMFHTLAELKNQVNVSQDERESELRADIERMTVQAADRVIASTHVDRSHLETYYAAERSRVTILPCGVDMDLFRPGDRDMARRSLGFGDERLILFVGRIQQLKGIDLLLQAARVLADRRDQGHVPPFRVLMVGGRPSGERNDPAMRELHRLQRIAKELGIEDCIEWVGAVDQADLPRYYRAADVTVVPSTYESFGLVALESMACGTPVVASAVGGLLATVQNEQSGFLVEGREPRDYADRIALLLGASELRQRFSAHAIERAAQFGWRRVAAQLLDVYQDLALARRHGEPPATIWQK